MAVEYAAVHHYTDGPYGILTLHGALLSREGRGVLILGACGSGKSTLAVALWQRGWQLLGDDITLIDPHTRQATPAPRRISLRRESLAHLGPVSGQLHSEGCSFHPEDRHVMATTLHKIVILTNRQDSRLNPAAAVLQLTRYCNVTAHQGAMEAVQRLAPLVEAVPVFELGRTDLETMVAFF